MEPTQVAQEAPQQPQEMTLSGLAKGFLDDLEANPDPEQRDAPNEHQEGGEPIPEDDQEPEDQAQPEAEEAAPEEPATPMVEVTLDDGTTIQVPEAVKPHIMRDKDYRQKTMALAEQRKQYEQLTANAQQIAAQAQQMAPYHAQLFAMDNRANQIQQSLTHDLMTSDPIEFNRMQGELAILLRNRDSLASGISTYTAQIQQQQAELRSQQLALEAPKLFEEIPDLADGSVRENLGKYVKSQGINDFEFAHMTYSPAATKIAWKAQQYDRMVKEQAQAKTKIQTQVKAAPTVGKTGQAVKGEAKSKQAYAEWKKSGGGRESPHFKDVLRSITRG